MLRWLRRSLLLVLALQLLGAVSLALRGFPYFGSDLVSNAPVWELPVALFHLPGVLALSVTGLCCGFHNGLVLGPKIVGGHIRMSGTGILILAGTNLCLLLALVGAGWGGWRVRRRPIPPPLSNPDEPERP
jgi:hypothetical protein